MKVAVAFFGHLRTVENTFSSVQDYLLSKNDADVYIHTWDKPDRSTQSFRPSEWNGMDILTKDVLKRCYPASRIEIEEDRIGGTEKRCKYGRFNLSGIHAMHHSFFRVLEMISQSGTDYDVIIILRPDIILKERVDIKSIYTFFQSVDQPVVLRGSYANPVSVDNLSLNAGLGATDCLMATSLKSISIMLENKGRMASFYNNSYNKWAEDQFSYFLCDSRIRSVYWSYQAPHDWAIMRVEGEHSRFIQESYLFLVKIYRLMRNYIKYILRLF